jgi:ABC-type transport system involved in cytochrome c biogenesis permease subunit
MLKTAHPIQWVIVGLFGLYVGGSMIGAAIGDAPNQFQLREFGSLPVIDRGRIKPMDTFARSRVLLIASKQTFQDEKKQTRPATQWVLDAMLTKLAKGGGPALEYKMFRIENDQVLSLLGLQQREGLRYSLSEFYNHLADLDRESKRALKVEDRKRSVYETKVLELAQHVELFMHVAAFDSPAIVPAKGDWLALGEAWGNGDPHPVALSLAAILRAYNDHDVEGFNKAVAEYKGFFQKEMPEALRATGLEVYFNELAPFYICAVAYGFLFVLACCSWLGWFEPLNRGAFWSMVLIALVHTMALGMRIYIQGRPPVTNLYSSAIFIGWGCVVTCLISEYFFRNSIAIAVGSVTGGLSLLVAHFLSLESGDTMEMMEAVLDTNFWLATHVTCITLGYTATFVAGFMGITYVAAMAVSAFFGWRASTDDKVRQFLASPDAQQGARRFFTRFFDTDAGSVMGKMIYGIVCFGMFLSFTGTVLGGLWADVSWGRFWGWDPKENGALLIVIWCALILHARWGGMVKQRGMAILAVLGNIITAWSWFGTNFLGVGLHSYGFMAGAMTWLLVFDAAMLVIAGIGLLPLAQWAKLPARQPAATTEAVTV